MALPVTQCMCLLSLLLLFLCVRVCVMCACVSLLCCLFIASPNGLACQTQCNVLKLISPSGLCANEWTSLRVVSPNCFAHQKHTNNMSLGNGFSQKCCPSSICCLNVVPHSGSPIKPTMLLNMACPNWFACQHTYTCSRMVSPNRFAWQRVSLF